MNIFTFINRWHDVLVMYPRSSNAKRSRRPTFPINKPPTDPTANLTNSSQVFLTKVALVACFVCVSGEVKIFTKNADDTSCIYHQE